MSYKQFPSRAIQCHSPKVVGPLRCLLARKARLAQLEQQAHKAQLAQPEQQAYKARLAQLEQQAHKAQLAQLEQQAHKV